ncbi:Imm50 family immunity protein [Streptomyces toxytricini]|uniref:Imm50 family immunity protein n=1 Tax=Streptomyces toxytricini TaxID=67369 RepID=A0ABW8EGF0_STRT5
MSEPITWPELQALYGTHPVPDLNTCHSFHVHVDERDTSVTLGFETQQLPPHPKPEWTAKAYNTLCFWLEFTGVSDLRVHGILAEAERSVRITHGDTIRVAIHSNTRSMAFTATTARVSHTRVYLQGPI